MKKIIIIILCACSIAAHAQKKKYFAEWAKTGKFIFIPTALKVDDGGNPFWTDGYAEFERRKLKENGEDKNKEAIVETFRYFKDQKGTIEIKNVVSSDTSFSYKKWLRK